MWHWHSWSVDNMRDFSVMDPMIESHLNHAITEAIYFFEHYFVCFLQELISCFTADQQGFYATAVMPAHWIVVVRPVKNTWWCPATEWHSSSCWDKQTDDRNTGSSFTKMSIGRPIPNTSFSLTLLADWCQLLFVQTLGQLSRDYQTSQVFAGCTVYTTYTSTHSNSPPSHLQRRGMDACFSWSFPLMLLVFLLTLVSNFL